VVVTSDSVTLAESNFTILEVEADHLFIISAIFADEGEYLLAVLIEIFGSANRERDGFSCFAIHLDRNFEVRFQPVTKRKEATGTIKVAEETEETLYAAAGVTFG
tara:strand:+ start:5364 stop:5678 length:315 start_codon:yes stop_codon:yes gene_type:complete